MTLYIVIKRLFDIFFSLLGFCILIPLFVAIKVSFMLVGDKGKIIYHQTRVGKDGKLFNIYKFRSMIQNADEVLKDLLKNEKYRTEWEKNQKLEEDPRITKIGRFLRKTSLDELPQLVNILKGDMSIVGPRPLVQGELEDHGGSILYWKVKPGLTGWWACHGRSNLNYKERLEMEYYYINHFSFKLDFICICKTFYYVLTARGAK